MKCPRWQHENPVGRKFCGSGTPVQSRAEPAQFMVGEDIAGSCFVLHSVRDTRLRQGVPRPPLNPHLMRRR